LASASVSVPILSRLTAQELSAAADNASVRVFIGRIVSDFIILVGGQIVAVCLVRSRLLTWRKDDFTAFGNKTSIQRDYLQRTAPKLTQVVIADDNITVNGN